MLIDFIIPTYNRPDLLRCILSSLICQTDGDWTANVVIDGTDHLSSTLKVIDSLSDIRIKYTILENRYNNWGQTPRQIGKQNSVADYIIMTGDDNYYTPNLVEEIRKYSAANPALIYWNMVHSHANYQCYNCELRFERIDMGAFATRRDVAQKTILSEAFAADGLFIEQIKKDFPDEVFSKIGKILYVHN